MAWTYSDWNTAYAEGTAARQTRLDLHIQEVADSLQTGSYSMGGRNVNKQVILDYLKSLRESRVSESAASGAAAGTRSSWTRALGRLNR